VVNLLRDHLKYPNKKSYLGEQKQVVRIFWHVNLADVDHAIESTCSSIKGTKDVHSIWFVGSIDVNKLLKKSLVFFLVCGFYFQLVKICLGQINGRLKY
jgi:hypothetical protein